MARPATRLVGTFLRAGRPRTPIAGAAIGIGYERDRRVMAWATTDAAGTFLFRLRDPGPWKLQTRVRGEMIYLSLGHIDYDRALDFVLTAGAILAYEAGTSRRARYA